MSSRDDDLHRRTERARNELRRLANRHAAPRSKERPMSRTVTAAKTDGVSPKATAAALAPIVVGLLLAAADKLFAGDDIPDELWLGLIGAGPLAGLSAFGAKPGRVRLQEAGPAAPPPVSSSGDIGPL